MRLFCALRATVLLVCAASATAHADGVRSVDTTGAAHARVACNCPAPVYRSALRRHYRAIRRYREWPEVAQIAVVEPPDLYNPPLPGTLDTAYERAMTLHFRNPAVTGIYQAELGWPPTPPVHGLVPYRVKAWGAVYQYDGLIGQYVALAHSDAARVAAVASQLGP